MVLSEQGESAILLRLLRSAPRTNQHKLHLSLYVSNIDIDIDEDVSQ